MSVILLAGLKAVVWPEMVGFRIEGGCSICEEAPCSESKFMAFMILRSWFKSPRAFHNSKTIGPAS